MALRRVALAAFSKDRECVYDGGQGRSALLFMCCFDCFAILSLWSEVEVEADMGNYTNACFYARELKLKELYYFNVLET